MSTHMHLLAQTNSPKNFMICLRMLYTMYFNKKYGRSGKLGENLHFTIGICLNTKVHILEPLIQKLSQRDMLDTILIP